MDVETEMTLAKLRAEIDELRSRLDAVEDEAADAADGAEVGGDAEVRGSGQWDLPDADACAAGFTDATRSVETVPSTGLQQIYKFAGGGYAVTAGDLSAEDPPSPLPVFLMRMKVDADGKNALSVAYCTPAVLKAALAGGESGEGENPAETICGDDADFPSEVGGGGAGNDSDDNDSIPSEDGAGAGGGGGGGSAEDNQDFPSKTDTCW